MKKQIIILLVIASLCFSRQVMAQELSKEESFDVLGQLVGGIWTYEGKWPSGEPFKQEKKFSWGLNKQIIKVQTYGAINMETKEHGLRNEGIRAWETTENNMKFYEFDVFGGVTVGKCIVEADRFHYEYNYEVEGKQELFRDTWKKVDDNTFEYSVNMKVADGWKTFTTNLYSRSID